eukprot:TRINITY_DN8913_c0_g1_i2.p1 TRINITY_DN8913_c0_g1~~TRINITY_DN8913_c0_g1_i2.p1  ORF type:complete len:405 (+),score=34.87 TRINITY_DN8913_c0_g1_i2:66-1280(+)
MCIRDRVSTQSTWDKIKAKMKESGKILSGIMGDLRKNEAFNNFVERFAALIYEKRTTLSNVNTKKISRFGTKEERLLLNPSALAQTSPEIPPNFMEISNKGVFIEVVISPTNGSEQKIALETWKLRISGVEKQTEDFEMLPSLSILLRSASSLLESTPFYHKVIRPIVNVKEKRGQKYQLSCIIHYCKEFTELRHLQPIQPELVSFERKIQIPIVKIAEANVELEYTYKDIDNLNEFLKIPRPRSLSESPTNMTEPPKSNVEAPRTPSLKRVESATKFVSKWIGDHLDSSDGNSIKSIDDPFFPARSPRNVTQEKNLLADTSLPGQNKITSEDRRHWFSFPLYDLKEHGGYLHRSSREIDSLDLELPIKEGKSRLTYCVMLCRRRRKTTSWIANCKSCRHHSSL